MADSIPEHRLIAAIGEGAAWRLMAERGGLEVYVPSNVGGSTLEGLVGNLAARQMLEAFGPGQLLVPAGGARGQGARRRTAQRLLREGRTVAQAALVSGLHQRTVFRIKADLQAGSSRASRPRQGDLFD
ncbi:MAG: hypothetical protein ACU0CO_01285 [Shimia sp.]